MHVVHCTPLLVSIPSNALLLLTAQQIIIFPLPHDAFSICDFHWMSRSTDRMVRNNLWWCTLAVSFRPPASCIHLPSKHRAHALLMCKPCILHTACAQHTAPGIPLADQFMCAPAAANSNTQQVLCIERMLYMKTMCVYTMCHTFIIFIVGDFDRT